MLASGRNCGYVIAPARGPRASRGENAMSALMLGAATVDPSARTISSNGLSRRISPKAMAVLGALMKASGDVVSREALLAHVWPEVTVGEEVLTQAITELRRAFGDRPQNAQYIKTVPKTGYCLLQSPVENC